ncbi:MAG TPA: ATP-binding protein [Ignavibacteriaceae bacterium]|nr:ATP-binding protein [Ignavibacteriaceae bacterium]
MKNFRINLIIRILILVLSILVFFYTYFNTGFVATLIILALLIIYLVISTIRYIDETNKELSRFLHSIKYSDFSQTFIKQKLGSSFKELNNSFNEVMSEFQKTRAEKEEHYRFVQTVIQHIGVGLISFNQDGKVEFINNAAKKIFKIPHLNNIETLNSVSPGLAGKFLKIKTGEKNTIKIIDEEEIIQLIVFATEFKMRNQRYTLLSLQNIQYELEEKEMEAWQKLIRVLTHEIMNSVTPISSLAGTVHEMIDPAFNGKINSGSEPALDTETVNDIKVAVDTIKKRSEGLIHFVDDYRSLTSLPEPVFQIVLIKDLFGRIRRLMENDLKTNNIKLVISIEPEKLELTADSELIEQVLINLIVNSIYFLKGIENPQIKLSGQIDERGKTVIKVSDNGPGISEELMDKIFIPFFSTKKGGSGIGLSLSRQIMRSHGGSIHISSKPFAETTFTLKF